jgi:3-phytase
MAIDEMKKAGIVLFVLLLAGLGLFWLSLALQELNPPEEVPFVEPVFVSDPVEHNSDDAAVWIDLDNPGGSLVLGTDKGNKGHSGALYVYDLQGNMLNGKTIRSMRRPNNVDVAYDLKVGDRLEDIAVVTDRDAAAIRVFSLPDMRTLDGGGITVFEGEEENAPMGVGLYTSPAGDIYAIISRNSGPSQGYLWQYKLLADSKGRVRGELVRKFGAFSGEKCIEAIAVDNELGYVYYADERAGIRKYYAHPDSSARELAFFGRGEFEKDIEGISIYKQADGSGYIVVSDQEADQFHVFAREGSLENAHDHQRLTTFMTEAEESDGNEVTSVALPGYPKGLFVAMSTNKRFYFYSWEELAQKSLLAPREEDGE